MLKSCVRPCEVLIVSRKLTVTRSVVAQYVAHPLQPQQQLRHKSSKQAGQYSRWNNKKSNASATEHAPRSVSKSSLPKPTTTAQQQSQDSKSDPKPSAQVDNGTSFRPLFIDPVKPTPNQDLASTRPADLETVPSAKENESGNIPISARASYFFRLGKSYVTFYKTGVKNIWNNRKEYKKIKARLGSHTLESVALYGGQAVNPSRDSSRAEGKKIPTITRREYQLSLRTKHDLGKLIPFGIVFAICGEFTPLVILALGSRVVPYTCRIPKQAQHDRKWFEKRIDAHNPELVIEAKQQAKDRVLEQGPEYYNALAFLHGVSPFAKLPPVIGNLLFKLWIEPRLNRRGLEILADTVLIRREGGFNELEPIEVYEYANRFFCPQLVMANRADLQTNGIVDWPRSRDKGFDAFFIEALEKHATKILTADWASISEPDRPPPDLVFDAAALERFRAAEKAFEEIGNMPQSFRDRPKEP